MFNFFCGICRFFNVESAKCAAEHRKSYHQILQKFGGNEKSAAIFTNILMAAFGAKNVHSAMSILKCKIKTFDFFRFTL